MTDDLLRARLDKAIRERGCALASFTRSEVIAAVLPLFAEFYAPVTKPLIDELLRLRGVIEDLGHGLGDDTEEEISRIDDVLERVTGKRPESARDPLAPVPIP